MIMIMRIRMRMRIRMIIRKIRKNKFFLLFLYR